MMGKKVMNVKQNFNDRNEFVNVRDTTNLRVWRNILVNRLTILNDKIKHDWMNYSLET